MTPAPYPSIRVRGSAHERGLAYGEACRARVRASLAGYRTTFENLGTEWRRARRLAQGFRDHVADYAPGAAAEIRGLAAGAAVDELDVLALNLRTEILAVAQRPGRALPAECTAFAVLAGRSANGHVLLAQNWDWMPHSQHTLLVLEVERDEAPSFTTVVEAGLLAKIGLNAAGVGVMTNALRTSNDPAEDGIPYHLLLRSLFDCDSLDDAVALLERTRHASSANYLLASNEGAAVDLEAEAGSATPPRRVGAVDEILAHTNHFLARSDRTNDLGPTRYPSTERRLETAIGLVNAARAASIETLQQALVDHDGYPLSICAHPDTSAPPEERGLTAASLVMDMTARRIWLADGNPCSHPYRELNCAFLFGSRGASPREPGLASHESA